jgi:glutathione synthase/RimK-type ligase-like ATP-grasp enzyme
VIPKDSAAGSTEFRCANHIPKEVAPVKKIGVLFGMENTFPGALVEKINAKNLDGISAEFVEVGAVRLDRPPVWSVIVDRISHDIPFYRAFLKHAVLHGATVINNPFWWSADDKFFNYSLAAKLGVAAPPTVILPHKHYPPGTTERSMRNLQYPLDWNAVFDYVGFPAFLKPVNGGGWRDVYQVRNREEFFHAYDQSRDLCMMLQRGVNFTEYFRCYVVGQEKVHIMPYDPRRPHAARYILDAAPAAKELLHRVEKDALALCRALGYDLNTVEFAVENGVAYAIDFMNPAPDADLHSVGQANFDWIVNAVADLAVKKAKAATPKAPEFHWSAYLSAAARGPARKTTAAKTPARKSGKPAKRAAAQEVEPVATVSAIE